MLWSLLFPNRERTTRPQGPKGYRPVSLTSYLGKLFERMLTAKISDYLFANGQISRDQYGFRENTASTDAVLRFCQSVVNCQDTRTNDPSRLAGITGVVFTDLSAAYDQVWKQALGVKLMRVY